MIFTTILYKFGESIPVATGDVTMAMYILEFDEFLNELVPTCAWFSRGVYLEPAPS
jgi:hypothetical protein